MSAGQLFHCRLLTDAGAIRTSHASSSHQSARLPAATLCLASDCSRASGAGLQVRRQSRTLTGITTHGPRTCSHRGLKAEPDGKETAASPETSTPADAEARLEALERGAKRGKGAQTVIADARQRAKQGATESGGVAEWKEGQLFPDGWDQMPLSQKLYELYTGKRGFLYWTTQAAWYSIFGLVGAWIVFRFVLPALGLYQLANDLQTPPNL